MPLKCTQSQLSIDWISKIITVNHYTLEQVEDQAIYFATFWKCLDSNKNIYEDMKNILAKRKIILTGHFNTFIIENENYILKRFE